MKHLTLFMGVVLLFLLASVTAVDANGYKYRSYYPYYGRYYARPYDNYGSYGYYGRPYFGSYGYGYRYGYYEMPYFERSFRVPIWRELW